MPPPTSFLRAAPGYRLLPPPLNIPSSQPNQPTAKRPSKQFSQRYLIPSTPDCPSGSNTQATLLHTPLAGHQGTISDTPIAAISSRALRHGSDRVAGNVDFDESWIESHLAELEFMSWKDFGGKGRPYLGVWLGIREAGLREKQSVIRFISEKLTPYPWYKGNKAIKEALHALVRLEYINAGLLAKKHTENANWFWNKKMGDLTVREYWVEEGTKLRQKEQAQKQAQE